MAWIRDAVCAVSDRSVRRTYAHAPTHTRLRAHSETCCAGARSSGHLSSCLCRRYSRNVIPDRLSCGSHAHSHRHTRARSYSPTHTCPCTPKHTRIRTRACRALRHAVSAHARCGQLPSCPCRQYSCILIPDRFGCGSHTHAHRHTHAHSHADTYTCVCTHRHTRAHAHTPPPCLCSDMLCLRTLDADNCQLRALPASLSRLANLMQLFVCHNQLTALPDELPQSLKEVDVRDNHVRPRCVCMTQIDTYIDR